MQIWHKVISTVMFLLIIIRGNKQRSPKASPLVISFRDGFELRILNQEALVEISELAMHACFT